MQRILLILLALISLTPFKGYSQQKEHVFQLNQYDSIQYLLYLPKDYHAKKENYPILLFLHGGGESGNNIEKVKKNGPPMLVENGNDFPFIILSPQNKYVKKYWDEQAVIALLNHVIKNYAIDTSRIYLSGMSRGGYGAWQLAIQYPEKFAALLVICGVAPSPYAGWIDKTMPIWVFHGEDDTSIPIAESERMVKALNEKEYNVQFTRYPDTKHDAWTKTYANPKVYEWLLQQKKSFK